MSTSSTDIRRESVPQERIVIVGAGPAAAASALALTSAGQRDVTVVDVGGGLSQERRLTVARMSEQTPEQWSSDDAATITQQPVVTKQGLPQKRSYGSDYPFANLGQLDGLSYDADANESAVSSAYGGFSNVWGAQLMPFSRATIDTWPVTWEQFAPHYSAVLDEVPLAADHDDFESLFPLLTDRAEPLPPLASRSDDVLARYARHRDTIRDKNITLGRARLAMRAHECVRCGLCMTGCPYGLIYSASQTLDRLRAEGSIHYRPGLLATRVGEDEQGCFVAVTELASGRREVIRADRVFVAAGGMGSTRLVAGSLPGAPDSYTMGESAQFAVPFVSGRTSGDPRLESTFTLNQFNMLIGFDDVGYNTSHVHCYAYNPSMLTALPGPLQNPALDALAARVLGRLTIGLGYLPSWASPPVKVTVDARPQDALPELTIGGDGSTGRPLMLKRVLKRLREVGPLLDLHPVSALIRLAAPAKSYHFGGSFPHRAGAATPATTDTLGRPGNWQRIHMVDGAVLPSVPSTTFTFTVMANAHRIATEALLHAPLDAVRGAS